MARKCLKNLMISTIKKKNESEKAKPDEKKTSRVNSMVLFPRNRDGGEGLMFVDINIAGQKRSALVDTRASDLFIWEKAAKKLGLSIRKSNKKINTVNFEEAPTVGVVQNVELQIGELKSNEEFEVVGALSKFLSNEAEGLWAVRSQDVRIKGIPMRTSQNWGKLEQRLLANEMYQLVQRFKLRGDKSRGKGFEGRDNRIARQVGKKPR
ncbi:hypothetical protein Goklo_001433 [Gossypium klotzschianum]|uniref:Uncharacterized protein n=1 Tax=Gossypium klotzschianum TaxID=34286 RepID=A0A7J8W1H0_9ROSI|nr:hypothetical protein [Gossypium klotzschianum]